MDDGQTRVRQRQEAHHKHTAVEAAHYATAFTCPLRAPSLLASYRRGGSRTDIRLWLSRSGGSGGGSSDAGSSEEGQGDSDAFSHLKTQRRVS